ncbi:hypothetical protein A2U01_0076995, partial [Trifolium medium]|nr:hypothetical protein [Trifolium medium]
MRNLSEGMAAATPIINVAAAPIVNVVVSNCFQCGGSVGRRVQRGGGASIFSAV